MPGKHGTLEKPGYVAKLIGYLSFGMLAAALGSVLGEALSRLWLIFGMLGLVSALGLNVLSRTRARSKYLKKRQKLSLQAEKHLSKIVVVEESFDEISEAVRRIQSDAAKPKTKGGKPKHEAGAFLNEPVIITPLQWSRKITDKSVVGRVRNISGYGFGLAHDCSLQRGYVLLEFEFENREPVEFIADLLWCEAQSNGQFFSGGKLLEVVNPVAVGAE